MNSQLSRRKFLTTSAASITASCGSQQTTFKWAKENCPDTTLTGPIRIDSHCHLMNLRDVSAGPFLSRRTFNLDERYPSTVEAIASAIATLLGKIARVSTTSAQKEAFDLGKQLEREVITPELSPQNPVYASPENFCFWARRNQWGFIKAESGRQNTGMLSNRVRNAARMIDIFHQVDLFTPSIVDLYDDRKALESIEDQIDFYRNLNLATRGRFLPMMSFNPQRQYQMEAKEDFVKERDYLVNDYLASVEKAIRDEGFIGVKVHPSSGFSPYDNLRFGCTNTRTQITTESDKKLYKRFKSYDESMAHLFRICRKYDVPVLTHNSQGLSANIRCMRGDHPDVEALKEPVNNKAVDGEWGYLFRKWGGKPTNTQLNWTNSPQAWVAAIDLANSDARSAGNPDLRVSLGHFAGAFKETRDKTAVNPSSWLEYAAKSMESRPNLYIDLSEINEFFAYGKDDPDRIGIIVRYYTAFRKFLKANEKLSKNMLYGTDWHMPPSARNGPDYIALIETLLPTNRIKELTMGQNAVDFFGLKTGKPTRERLRVFYKKHNVPLDEIRWWSRIG